MLLIFSPETAARITLASGRQGPCYKVWAQWQSQNLSFNNLLLDLRTVNKINSIFLCQESQIMRETEKKTSKTPQSTYPENPLTRCVCLLRHLEPGSHPIYEQTTTIWELSSIFQSLNLTGQSGGGGSFHILHPNPPRVGLPNSGFPG